MLHSPIRAWWTFWRRPRCSCGLTRYPCPDTGQEPDAPLGDGSRAGWDGPTQRLRVVQPPILDRPLIARGQAWRTRQVGR